MLYHALAAYVFLSVPRPVDFDVLDSAAIADALEHPERHQQLVIRVCGYSARFVDLSREMQLEIAGRAQRAV